MTRFRSTVFNVARVYFQRNFEKGQQRELQTRRKTFRKDREASALIQPSVETNRLTLKQTSRAWKICIASCDKKRLESEGGGGGARGGSCTNNFTRRGIACRLDS